MIGFVTSGQRCKNELWHLLYSKKPKAKEHFDEYTRKMASVVNKPEKEEYLRTYVLGNWAAIRRTWWRDIYEVLGNRRYN